MAAELIAGLGLFKSMFDMAKGLKDINDATIRNGAIIELQEHIVSARGQQTALTERISELEKEVAEFETWEAEKHRYELKELARGFVAYVLKEPERQTSTAHAICTNCYERRFKSILQSNGAPRVHDHAFNCPSCKASFACQSKNMNRLFESL